MRGDVIGPEGVTSSSADLVVGSAQHPHAPHPHGLGGEGGVVQSLHGRIESIHVHVHPHAREVPGALQGCHLAVSGLGRGGEGGGVDVVDKMTSEVEDDVRGGG